MIYTNKDKVVEITDAPQSSVGAPIPIVMSDESDLYVAYYLQNAPEGWDGTTVKLMSIDSEGEPIAIVKFPSFLVYQFGPPNDEAFSGHPLYKKGLRPYGVFEIKASSWVDYFEKMNSVHPSHKKELFQKYRHFVFSFHDTTLEIISDKFEFDIITGSLKSAAKQIQEKLGW